MMGLTFGSEAFSGRWATVAAAATGWWALQFLLLFVVGGWPLKFALYDSAVTTLVLLLCGMAIINLLLHYLPAANQFWFAFAVSVMLSWLAAWVIGWVLREIGAGEPAFLALQEPLYPVRWLVVFLAVGAMALWGVMSARLADQRQQSERAATTAAMVKDAELQKLQLQLQPHFLFNCLNSINALVISRPKEAQEMVQHLSAFLRTTMKRADQHWVSLAEEWNYLHRYLAIEKVRFGHRLVLNMDFSSNASDWQIPTLLLQPLVENAIKFGLYGTTGPVVISLNAKADGRFLEIEVTNPFDPDSRPDKGNGFGLSGLSRRLYLLYARNDLLRTSVNEHNFVVTLKLPAKP